MAKANAQACAQACERRWSLIGAPDHQGVINVGGRVGSARGPAAFRKALARMSGTEGVTARCDDLGDVADLSQDVSRNHRQAADKLKEAHLANGLSVMVGGGHDHGFSHLLGLKEALPGRRIGCINIDAHLDVRKPAPLISSGSPFYLALEAKVIEPGDLIEFGIQPHCNGPALWEYARSKGIEIVEMRSLRHGKAVTAFRAALKALSARCDLVAISLDLDAVASAFAPGVSAPQAEGFSSSELLEMMEIAGASAKARSLGIFELNPEHDVDNRTAILAATAAFRFIAEFNK